jgi:hypothetical protein
MKITIDRPKKSVLDGFLSWIKGLAESPEHEADRDLIADFLDKVLIAEAKKISTDSTMVSEEIEVPDEIFMVPLQKKEAELKAAYKAKWNNIRRIINGIDPDTAEDGALVQIVKETSSENKNEDPLVMRPEVAEAVRQNSADLTPQNPTSKIITRTRIGNGHVRSKKRPLASLERDCIRDFFLNLNGQIEDDNCVSFKRDKMPAEVGIFQVTGFVSYLHREVAEGRTVVNNLTDYEQWMRTKYGQLWAQYNSPRFVEVRAANARAIAAGQKPNARVSHTLPLVPAFTHFPGKKA